MCWCLLPLFPTQVIFLYKQLILNSLLFVLCINFIGPLQGFVYMGIRLSGALFRDLPYGFV